MQGEIRWLGHSFVEYKTADKGIVLFDPWSKDDGNPACPLGNGDIERADLALISHDHFDHMGSAIAICNQTGALLGGPVQTMRKLTEQGLKDDLVVNFGYGYMVGGGVDLGWVKVTATPALHSSDSACPLGTIVTTADGTQIYHAGDTGLFSEMELYGRLYPLDLAMIPIGGVFTMDAYQAAEAVRLLNPKKVMPIHYGSFPIIAQTADEFRKLCAEKNPGVEILTPKVGETISL